MWDKNKHESPTGIEPMTSQALTSTTTAGKGGRSFPLSSLQGKKTPDRRLPRHRLGGLTTELRETLGERSH